MGKLSKQDMDELRYFCSLGCEFSGTEEIVDELICETVKDVCGEKYYGGDEAAIYLDSEYISSLDYFIYEFWDKAVNKIMNVVETQGDEYWENLGI